MSSVHSNEFWLDADVLALNWAPDSITELDNPSILNLIWLIELRNKDAVVSTGLDVDETLHIFHRFFINFCVPESNTHIISLWFSISEYDGIIEVRPDVLWLNICKEDVGIDGENNSETEALPSDAVDHS